MKTKERIKIEKLKDKFQEYFCKKNVRAEKCEVKIIKNKSNIETSRRKLKKTFIEQPRKFLKLKQQM